jgi:methionine-rich copper-binding protein CopC
MKKFFGITTLALLTLIVPQVTQAQTAPTCHNFNGSMFFYLDTYYSRIVQDANALHDGTTADANNAALNNLRTSTKALQSALEQEGFTIDATEKSKRDFGLSTASAVVQFQNKYKAQILTPRGLASGTGVVDEDTRKVLNQKYGCIDKAVIDLTSPNTGTVKARGEILPIKWTASKIPNQATLNINYVKADGTGTTSIATSTISNGKGSYDWTIPSTLSSGSYKVQLVITGSVRADISVKAFEVRETALQILTQNSTETYSVGQKVTLNWKTSAAIKPSDSLHLQLVSSSTPANATPALYDIDDVKNDGAYVWTVPEKISDRLIANGGQYKFVLSTKNGASYTDSTDAGFTITRFERKLSVTAPSANMSFSQGGTAIFRWTHANLTGNVKITAKEKFPASGQSAAIEELGSFAITTGEREVKLPLDMKTGTYTAMLSNTTAGIVATSSVDFVVISKSRAVAITSPNGGERFTTEPTFEIAWSTTGIDTTVSKFELNLIDTVANRTTLLKDLPKTAKNYVYTIPKNGVQGSIVGIGTFTDARYKIEVKALSDSGSTLFSDQSNTGFSIVRSTAVVVLTKPAAGNKIEVGTALKAEWTFSDIALPNQSATVELLNASGATVQVLSTGATKISTKSASANLAAGVVAGMYKIRLTAVLADGTRVQVDSATFEITNKVPVVAVETPNTASEYKTNKPVVIKWSIRNLPTSATSYEINLVDTSASKTQKITSVGRTALTASWNVPANGILGSGANQITGIGDSKDKKYKIEVKLLDVSGANITSDQSDVTFAVSR